MVALLAKDGDPFAGKRRPDLIRIERYHYQFNNPATLTLDTFGEEGLLASEPKPAVSSTGFSGSGFYQPRGPSGPSPTTDTALDAPAEVSVDTEGQAAPLLHRERRPYWVRKRLGRFFSDGVFTPRTLEGA